MNTDSPSLESVFTIGDVSRICHIPSHTIRYWEKEFFFCHSPSRTSGNQRRYSELDIKRLLEIKKLLWEDKFTIEGAKRLLKKPSFLPLLGGAELIRLHGAEVAAATM